MKWPKWSKIKTALLVAEKVAVLAGQHGVTIEGRNPAEIDAAAHAAATAMVQTLKKPTGPTQKPAS